MPTILIIDDDPEFQIAAERLLAKAGYNLLQAADGNEAIERLEREHHRIDLAIVDLALPGINGFEIIGALSRRPNPVKVLATSSVYRDEHLAMAGALGAHAAIRKPRPGTPLPEGEWLGTIERLIGAVGGDQRGRAAGANGPAEDSGAANGTKTDY
jgi:CheY-like chemotaxis protein